MSNQLAKGASDGLGGCNFCFYRFHCDYRCCQPTHPERGERWREQNN